MEVSLDQAIAHSELRVFFQPKISLATGKPVGAEALVRWKSSTRGLVAPEVFLPVAETIGFMKPMTIWMLNSALRLSADWTRKWGRLSVAVNIPPSILGEPDFTDLVLNGQCRPLPRSGRGVPGFRYRDGLQETQSIERSRDQDIHRRFRHRLFQPLLFPGYSDR